MTTGLKGLAFTAVCLAASAVSAADAPPPSNCPSVQAGKCFTDLSTGIRMAYVEVGPKDGKSLILLHGLTDSSRSWAETMAKIHEKDPSLHVIAVDQRGHGAASMPDEKQCAKDPKACFTPKQFADDLIAFMDAKGLDKSAIAGHSMGSMIAQELALDHPDRITAAVLVASTASSKGNSVLQQYVLDEPVKGSWQKALTEKGVKSPEAIYNATPQDADPDIQMWLAESWVVSPYANSGLVQAIANETAQVKIGTWAGATEALLDYDNSKRLTGLKVPTLALWGSQDTIFMRSPDQKGLIDALAKAHEANGTPTYWKQYGTQPLPDTGLQVGDLGHNLQWEAPEAVANDIVSFLETGKPTRDQVKAGSSADGSSAQVTPNAAEIIGKP